MAKIAEFKTVIIQAKENGKKLSCNMKKNTSKWSQNEFYNNILWGKFSELMVFADAERFLYDRVPSILKGK